MNSRMTPDRRRVARRDVLRVGVAGLGALCIPRLSAGAITASRPSEGEDDATRLVLIELAGGNDGLNTIVPKSDDAYHNARKVTRLAPKSLLPLDDYRGFHPVLANLREQWESGRTAIVEGVGYPSPNRSHFKSQEIWGCAHLSGKAAGDGWIGNLLAREFAEEVSVTRAVHVGPKLPDPMISSKHPVLCLAQPSQFRWADERTAPDAATVASDGDSMRDRLTRVLTAAQSSTERVRGAVARYKTSVEFPDTDLGDALHVGAALLEGQLGTRIVSVTHPGFDTHAHQMDAHEGLLRDFDQSLGAFCRAIAGTAVGKNTVIMVYSEFGRRVAENASKGTDHGAAAPMFVLGDSVKGGLYGEHPSLTELDDGDLIHSVDFRSVYSTVLQRVFGPSSVDVLDGRFDALPLFETA